MVTNGFPRYAALTSSDEDFGICRRFQQLRWRRILQLQVELTELEKELECLDKADFENKDRKHRLRRTLYKDGWNAEQEVLFEKIDIKQKKYGKRAFLLVGGHMSLTLEQMI
jgi:ATP/maltotriose-dependent transcriptional regulator MalT